MSARCEEASGEEGEREGEGEPRHNAGDEQGTSVIEVSIARHSVRRSVEGRRVQPERVAPIEPNTTTLGSA